MERQKTSSHMSIDRKIHSVSTTKQNQIQNELDRFIQQAILDSLVGYDPKLRFNSIPIVSRDQVFKQTHRQVYGLVWDVIRPKMISRLVTEGRSTAFVEILHSPSEWSRYDTDLFLTEIRSKKYLNGLALRDEFVRILQVIIKRDFVDGVHRDRQYPFELQDMDFTRNTIQMIFHARIDTEQNPITFVVALVLLVEFDVPAQKFVHETILTNVCSHSDINAYFKESSDGQKTRLTIHNSIKFLFDYNSTESEICDFVLTRNGILAAVLKGFLKLRKEWGKYIQRAAKYAAETVKLQTHTEKHRQSTCSVNSSRSGKSNTSSMKRSLSNFDKQIVGQECFFMFFFRIEYFESTFKCRNGGCL